MDDLLRKITKTWASPGTRHAVASWRCLRAGQQNLSPVDFRAFVADVPGADKLLKNAPPPSALSSLAGGIGSLFGGRKSATGALGGPRRVVRGTGRRHRHRRRNSDRS